MKPPESSRHDTWLDDRLEAYLDGDLATEERRRVEHLLAAEAAVAEADLRMARRVRAGLRSMSVPPCPPVITEAVLAEARRRTDAAYAANSASAEPRAARWARRMGELQAWWLNAWQPSLAMALLVGVVVLSALWQPRTAEQAASGAEVAQAMDEVRWTLAYLSQVGRNTGAVVRHDVLESYVAEPVGYVLSPLAGYEASPAPQR